MFGKNNEKHIYLVAIAQPTMPWAINDSLPDIYNVSPEGTLLTPDEKRQQAILWSTVGSPVVLEHAGMTLTQEKTPANAIVGSIVGGFVDRRQNLLSLLQLRSDLPGVAEIEEALYAGRPVGVSLMTRRYLGSTRKEIEHLGVTFTPAFGRDGSWTMDWAVDAAAFRERIRVYYGQEPGLFMPEELRAKLRQFETQDSEYLKKIRAYRERITGGNVDSWKSQLPHTIVVMAASDAMDLDPPATTTISAVTPVTTAIPNGSGRTYTASALQDHLMRIQSKPMVEDQITLADEILQSVEKEHHENPYRLGDPEGRKASELVESIENLRQQKVGVSKKMLAAAIERGFISPEAQYVIDKIRNPATAADVRTQPFASQLAAYVAASGQVYDETLKTMEKTKADLESERVKNQRAHEETVVQKQLADQRTRELQDLKRRFEATEAEMTALAARQKERDAKFDALAAAASSASPTPPPPLVVGVTASDAEVVRREKTGVPARNKGSAMAASLEEAVNRSREMPTLSRALDTLSSISFPMTPRPSVDWHGLQITPLLSDAIRINV
jgi:hypothetical protein